MNKEKFSFKILKECGSARTGKINTFRGQIDTPTFMTVGTKGTINIKTIPALAESPSHKINVH